MLWLEEFNCWKTLGGGNPLQMNAKTADAVVVLDEQFRKELRREENE